jgi:raffinose/stachyose/melibiose transport system permease protein
VTELAPESPVVRLPGVVAKQAVLVGACLVALAPTAFMAVTALKGQEEYQLDKLGLPDVLVLDHFRTILFESDFLLWMLNSAILVVGAVALSTVVACLAAYAFARMEFRGQGTLLAGCTALMAVPPVVLIVPLFILYTRLGLISSFGGAIVIYAGLVSPFSVYLLTTFFRAIPQDLFDAAVIDGASDLQTLRRVVLPVSLPALLTLGVVNALFVWNDLLIAVIFLQEDAKRTLMAGISVFQGRYNNQIPLTMAGMLVAAAPMLILYALFQRHFVRGLLAGAVK